MRNFLLAAVIGLGLPAMADAGTVSVSCPGTVVTTDREFTIEHDDAFAPASCLTWGPGNINGNPVHDPLLMPLLPDNSPNPQYLGDDYKYIMRVAFEKIEDVNGWIWTIILPPAPGGGTWVDLVLGFKSGEGQRDPDWAAFLIPDGLLTGSIFIDPEQAGGLSHINLYGKVEPATVPLPAASLLLVGALGGLGLAARRRRG